MASLGASSPWWIEQVLSDATCKLGERPRWPAKQIQMLKKQKQNLCKLSPAHHAPAMFLLVSFAPFVLGRSKQSLVVWDMDPQLKHRGNATQERAEMHSERVSNK